jgi:hypothetical protein
MGRIDIAHETMEANAPAGVDRIAALAQLPNISVKVSALPAFPANPTPSAT